jgi:hypothetical protein
LERRRSSLGFSASSFERSLSSAGSQLKLTPPTLVVTAKIPPPM